MNEEEFRKEKEEFRKEKLYELKKKSPGIAVLLSLIFTGAGHWYLGKIGKGFLFLFTQIVLWYFLMGWIIWIITPISAYRNAKKINKILRLEIGLEE